MEGIAGCTHGKINGVQTFTGIDSRLLEYLHRTGVDPVGYDSSFDVVKSMRRVG